MNMCCSKFFSHDKIVVEENGAKSGLRFLEVRIKWRSICVSVCFVLEGSGMGVRHGGQATKSRAMSNVDIKITFWLQYADNRE